MSLFLFYFNNALVTVCHAVTINGYRNIQASKKKNVNKIIIIQNICVFFMAVKVNVHVNKNICKIYIQCA